MSEEYELIGAQSTGPLLAQRPGMGVMLNSHRSP